MEELIGPDFGLEWIVARQRDLKERSKRAARRSKEFSKLMQIYRLERLPKPSTWISTHLLGHLKALRPNLETLNRRYGEGYVRSKFGLGVEGLRRVWNKVENGFTSDFAGAATNGLTIDQIFLMTLQYLREYKKLLTLGEEWGISPGLCSDLASRATYTLRAELCRYYAFPLPLEQLETKFSRIQLGWGN